MSNYVCSRCGASAYYDGRCGDGPVLTCNCDKYYTDENGTHHPHDRSASIYYDGRCGDGPIVVNGAKPVEDQDWGRR